MKKILTLIVLLAITITLSAQTSNSDTVYSSTGMPFYVGMEVKVNRGTRENGNFKWIILNQTGFTNVMTTTNNQSYNANQNALNRNNSNATYKITKISKRGKGRFVPLITIGAVRYEIDVDGAIEDGEIEVDDKYKKSNSTQTSTVIINKSKSDEIKELKTLLDDGLITTEEYDKLRKEIISK